ncbi:MAG: hypothetical protein HQL86_01015 [Magnetococcales bacterium]|nr:hypothetical protein [Magnetococcales bacterium]
MTLFLGASFKERFFHAFCEKIFASTKDYGIVLRLWQIDPANMAEETGRRRRQECREPCVVEALPKSGNTSTAHISARLRFFFAKSAVTIQDPHYYRGPGTEGPRQGLGRSPRVLPLTLARSFQEAFFAFFAKNAPRATSVLPSLPDRATKEANLFTDAQPLVTPVLAMLSVDVLQKKRKTSTETKAARKNFSRYA